MIVVRAGKLAIPLTSDKWVAIGIDLEVI